MKLSHKRKIAHKKGTYSPRFLRRRLSMHAQLVVKLGCHSAQFKQDLKRVQEKALAIKTGAFKSFIDAARRFCAALGEAIGLRHSVTMDKGTIKQV